MCQLVCEISWQVWLFEPSFIMLIFALFHSNFERNFSDGHFCGLPQGLKFLS